MSIARRQRETRNATHSLRVLADTQMVFIPIGQQSFILEHIETEETKMTCSVDLIRFFSIDRVSQFETETREQSCSLPATDRCYT